MEITALLIDDDRRLFELLGEYLGASGIRLEHASSGPSGLVALASGGFDLVLLDVMMPVMDGLEALRRIREKDAVPVIMLTARGDEADRVVGLELGADDYLPKPFSPRELLARIRAVLRRTRPRLVDERLSAAGLVIDVPRRHASLHGAELELTGLEFDLLTALARRAGRVVPRTVLLDAAGREDVTVSERVVDVHISHIRRKLGDDPRSPKRLRTVRGVGYVLVSPEEP
jgi:two-component system, OmpR family, response regulator